MSISPAVRRAVRFEELLAIPGGDGPYVFTRMFRESRRRERRQSQRNFKLLKRVDGAIREVVRSEEKVLFVTEGRGFSFWERWVLGWRRAFVFTEFRAIFLQLDAGRRPRHLHQQLSYRAINRIKEGGRSKVGIEIRGGGVVELTGLHRADRAVVTDLLQVGAKAPPGADAPTGPEDLCPRCYTNVRGRPRSCPMCRRNFKRGWLSALVSLVVPGLGSYLIGYRGFAVLELSFALSVWAGYLLGLDPWGLTDIRSALHPAWIFGVVHGADAVLAWNLTRRGLFVSGRD